MPAGFPDLSALANMPQLTQLLNAPGVMQGLQSAMASMQGMGMPQQQDAQQQQQGDDEDNDEQGSNDGDNLPDEDGGADDPLASLRANPQLGGLMNMFPGMESMVTVRAQWQHLCVSI